MLMLFGEATNLDWASIAEKGVTSAFFAVAFGVALWKVGNKLLDSHFQLVANANAKLDTAIETLESIDRKLDDPHRQCRAEAAPQYPHSLPPHKPQASRA